jgi:hypothetical protein
LGGPEQLKLSGADRSKEDYRLVSHVTIIVALTAESSR